MSTAIGAGEPRPRLTSQGQAFVYVLPCALEDILKIGFSRDPLSRMQTLHPRYYEFFDLQRAVLIETDSVKDARRIERALLTEVGLHRAPAPLVVRVAAAGHTEWFRGASDTVTGSARKFSQEFGYALHAPLVAWLGDALCKRSDGLFEWSLSAWWQIDCLDDPCDRRKVTTTLRNALDAYSSLDLRLTGRIATEVLDWYRSLPDTRQSDR